jgi:hypothetical protein
MDEMRGKRPTNLPQNPPASQFEAYLCPITHRWLDPFEVYRLLGMHSNFKWNRWVEMQNDPVAYDRLIDVARKALKMPRPDIQTGLSGFLEPQVEQAILAFASYVSKKEVTEKS